MKVAISSKFLSAFCTGTWCGQTATQLRLGGFNGCPLGPQDSAVPNKSKKRKKRIKQGCAIRDIIKI
jgi:hypothetical protein